MSCPGATKEAPLDEAPSGRRAARRSSSPAPGAGAGGRLQRLVGIPVLVLLLGAALPAAGGLEDELGRSEIRVYSAPFEIPAGATVGGIALPARLQRLGYRRVHRKPRAPGEFFWGHERFWVFQHAHQVGKRTHPEELWSLDLARSDGRILTFGDTAEGPPESRWLEPELLAESLEEVRAPRILVRFGDLPERVWRPLLAAEDARFFEHSGLDARGIARALLKNARAGRVKQGGSTITQQLIKMRDLTPRRTLGRKVSEAVRALELEAEHDKEEILQAYLNAVYYGHLDGVSLYGIGAASRAYFSKPAEDLTLAEAALLAGMVQGPNGYSPRRNPQRALTRQRWVLSRLEELGWEGPAEIARARDRGLPALKVTPPRPEGSPQLQQWLSEAFHEAAPRRAAKERGAVFETTLDAYLQGEAEKAVAEHLETLRSRHRRLRSAPLAAALVVVEGTTGAVLAYVGGDPRRPGDAFDRVREARRQPGSAVKPLILLEAFESCGGEEPLYPARRVLDRAVRVPVPGGPWEPRNDDGRFRGPVSLRQATVESLNVPFVRLARHCGFRPTARRLVRAGLTLPKNPPPAFVLGAVEASPLALAGAFTTFAEPLGERRRPYPLERIARPSGRTLERSGGRERRVSSAASAYLVRDLLREAVERGTGRGAQLAGFETWGKTGTSSDLRDAWFVGGAGSLVAAVWVGLDRGGGEGGSPLGLSGSAAALPLWKRILEHAAPAYPREPPDRPPEIVERWVEEETELLLRRERRGARREIFRRGIEPPRRRVFRADQPVPVLR